MRNPGVVIVGGGQAAFQTAAALRQQGYSDPVTIVGEELHPPYQRPPLSKGMLLGTQQARHAILRPGAFYEKQGITLVTGERITSLSPQNRRVTGTSGRDYPYRKLVLATGARNRILPVQGADFAGVCSLRNLADAEDLDRRIQSAENVAVVGGGFIGLEVAAAARARGKNVTVIEARPRLMERAVAPQVSQYFLDRHRAEGVRVLLNSSVEQLGGESKVSEVVLSDRGRIPADLVVVGIGVIPNVELARDAGLAVHNGITVNQYLETEDPDIYAIGDCAEYPNPFAATEKESGEYAAPLVRLESVQNAVDQASAIARNITGDRQPYRAAPWFWTTQFDVHLQMAGISTPGADIVTRGDPESGKFSLFYFVDGKLRAVDSINQPGVHLAARKLIEQGSPITPGQAADEDFDLKSAL